MLRNVVNYLFPAEGHVGKKITDKKWIEIFIPFASYTALVICGFLIYLGLIAKSPKPFFLTTQGFTASLATFWTLVFLLLSRTVRKKRRSPAVPLLLANFFAIQCFIGLILILGFQTSMEKKFKPHYQQISHTVRDKISEQKSLLKQNTQDIEKAVFDHQKKVQNNIDKMKEYQGSAFDRFRKNSEEFDKKFKKLTTEQDKRWAEQKARFNKHCEEHRAEKEKQWDKIRRDHLKHMGFDSEEIYGKIYPTKKTDSSNQPNIVDATETSSPPDGGMILNPPLIWDRIKWLKEETISDNADEEIEAELNPPKK